MSHPKPTRRPRRRTIRMWGLVFPHSQGRPGLDNLRAKLKHCKLIMETFPGAYAVPVLVTWTAPQPKRKAKQRKKA